jgi:hypothetical protein
MVAWLTAPGLGRLQGFPEAGELLVAAQCPLRGEFRLGRRERGRKGTRGDLGHHRILSQKGAWRTCSK